MKTLPHSQTPVPNQYRLKRQLTSKTKPAAARRSNAEPNPEDEGLYALVKEDEALRALHVTRLRATPGYHHLSDDDAAERVEQLIRLSALVFELLHEQEAVVAEYPITPTSTVTPTSTLDSLTAGALAPKRSRR